MNKTLAVSAIVLVVVIMGMSAVAPMIPQAYAYHGGPDPPQQLCDALNDRFGTGVSIPTAIVALLEHCGK